MQTRTAFKVSQAALTTLAELLARDAFVLHQVYAAHGGGINFRRNIYMSGEVRFHIDNNGTISER